MSQTLAAAIACSSVWTSVKTGTPTSVRMRRRISKPSVIPGPRKDFPDERLALSKLALKIYGILRRPHTDLSVRAISRQRGSLSMTQGPEIRKSPLRRFRTRHSGRMESLTPEVIAVT